MSHTLYFCIIEDCTKDLTLPHVERVLDIVAYTMCFASSINKLKRRLWVCEKKTYAQTNKLISKANIDKMGFIGYIIMKKNDQWQIEDYGNNGRSKKN